MARVIKTEDLSPGQLLGELEYWCYNGLDCGVTLEVFEEMPFEPYAEYAYNFSRAMQGPVLEMMMRGWKVDEQLREQLYDGVCSRQQRLRSIVEKYCGALGTEAPFGPKSESPLKLIHILYEVLKLPPQYEIDKSSRERKLSSNREALEKLQHYWIAKPLCLAILKYRDLDGERDVLGAKRDADGRWRASTNIVGTETGRFSQSENAFGTGRSFHNIEATLRRCWVADTGWKLCNIDLEQAEARLVGFLAFIMTGKSTYLDFCESGDLHTNVAKMVWPGIVTDKSSAKGIFYREFTYRDLAKRGGHATNYLTTPPTMARHLQIGKDICSAFQQQYFQAFPEIKAWHHGTAALLQTTGFLDTPLGRRRYFLGRRFDDATLREAIAYVPQSTISDIAKHGMYRIWKEMPEVQILHENHDNVIFQYREKDEQRIIPKALELMKLPITFNNKTLIIPPAAKVGWTWAEAEDLERAGLPVTDALISWEGYDRRTRQASAEFDRGVHRLPVPLRSTKCV